MGVAQEPNDFLRGGAPVNLADRDALSWRHAMGRFFGALILAALPGTAIAQAPIASSNFLP